MIINEDHFFLESSKYISEISKPLQAYGITYFTYTRTCANGNRLYLTTNRQVLQNYVNKQWYLSGNVESNPIKYKSEIFFWSTLPNQKVIDNNARAHGYDNGIFIFEREKDFCEIYGFAAARENYSVNNIYLNKMEEIKKFLLYFKDKASDILKKAKSSYINLPFNPDSPSFINNDIVSLQYEMSDYKLRELKLSKRQIECAKLIIVGKSMKEIAMLTQLSPRTVEDYVNTLKKKLNCRNKYELILRLHSHLNG